MSPADYQRRKAVFEAAMDAAPAERSAVIANLCNGDLALAEDARRLVQNAEAENSFLDAGAVPSRELKAGQVLCERFELLNLAGEGGMGQVWAAFDRRLREKVAVKTIQRRLAAEVAGLARLQRELQLARPIGHPNVCRVYELFDDPATEHVFLTMQLLEGETLAERLRREGRLVPAEALRLFEQVASGLAAVHAAGVVHRDLKPSNVMLVPDASAGQEKAVVMDFGLARAHQATDPGGAAETQAGQVMGTFEYMAPEQMRSEVATPAADVYALGLLLYEMLDGQAPFQGKNSMDVWMRRIREGPPALAANQRIPGLDPRVDTVIARCLEYEPATRFTSPLEAVAALHERPARTWLPLPPAWRAWSAAAALTLALVLAGAWFVPRLWRPAVPEDARRAYDDAQRDLAEGAAARAGAELRRALQRAPGFAAAQAALAETQLELDQVYQARESIQRAAYLAPDRSRLPEAEALHIDGVNLLILRDCPKALEALRRRAAVVEAPLRGPALASLARGYERCEMAGDARKTLDAAAAADPRNAAVRVRAAYLASRRKENDTAFRLLAEAETLYRERANFEGVAEVLATRGELAAERDELDVAGAQLQEAMSLARTTKSVQQQVRILLQQAIVARKRGALEEAQRLTTEGVELARRSDLETLAMQGLFTAANVDFIKNDFARAEAGYQQALDIATRYRDEGSQARAWLSLASLNVRRGQPGQAAEFLAKARPYFEKIANQRVLSQLESLTNLVRTAQGDFRPVVASFERQLADARKAADTEAATLAMRGLRGGYMEMGRWEEAVDLSQQLEAMTSTTANRGRDRLLHAEALAALGRVAEARRVWRSALELGGNLPDYRIKLDYSQAVIALFAGEVGRAEQLLGRLLNREDLDPMTRYYVEHWACTAKVWGADPRAGLAPCQRMVNQHRETGYSLLIRLGKSRVAEAHFRLDATQTAISVAGEIRADFDQWSQGSSEWQWRNAFIAAGGNNGREPQPWSGRSDVIKLMARNSMARR